MSDLSAIKNTPEELTSMIWTNQYGCIFDRNVLFLPFLFFLDYFRFHEGDIWFFFPNQGHTTALSS